MPKREKSGIIKPLYEKGDKFMDKEIYDNTALYLRQNKLEKAFEEFSLTYGVDLEDKKKVLYDDMVLLLFSLIMDLDSDYMYIARNIRLDSFNSNYDTNDTSNKLVRSIYNRDFNSAIYNLIDSKDKNRNFTSKEAIILELLNLNKRNGKKENAYMLELIKEEDYDLAVIVLKAKRNVRGLSKPERALLYAINALKDIKTTSIVPVKKDVEEKSVLENIITHNYYKALYLQEKNCHRNGVKLGENNLYLVINNICNTISEVEDTKQHPYLEKIEDEILEGSTNYTNKMNTLRLNKCQFEIFTPKKKITDEFLDVKVYEKVSYKN